MELRRKNWGVVLITAVLTWTAVGCMAAPLESEPPGETDLGPGEVPTPDQEPADETEWLEPEEELSTEWKDPPGLSCGDIRPGELGSGRSYIAPANGRVADCGPGMGAGSGALALMNSGPFGATAWDVVSRDGVDSGNLIAGGTFGKVLFPQRNGFHLLTSSISATTLRAFNSKGELLHSTSLLVGEWPQGLSAAADPRGGTVIALWGQAEGEDTRSLKLWYFDSEGRLRRPPQEVLTVSRSGNLLVIVGVDVRGRILYLWRELGCGTWTGQWLKRDGRALTNPFPAAVDPSPSSFTAGRLQPLIGGGLALRLEGEWVQQFPSGEAQALPPPSWLAAYPGSELTLIRHRQAYALVPQPTFIPGSGCQEPLLLFTRDGAACGDVGLPFGGNSCTRRMLGVGLDGTVIQQIDLDIPANNQCAWRWWPRLLR